MLRELVLIQDRESKVNRLQLDLSTSLLSKLCIPQLWVDKVGESHYHSLICHPNRKRNMLLTSGVVWKARSLCDSNRACLLNVCVIQVARLQIVANHEMSVHDVDYNHTVFSVEELERVEYCTDASARQKQFVQIGLVCCLLFNHVI